jgi:hypothetical protein
MEEDGTSNRAEHEMSKESTSLHLLTPQVEATNDPAFHVLKTFDMKEIPLYEMVNDYLEFLASGKKTRDRKVKEKRKLFYEILLKKAEKMTIPLSDAVLQLRSRIQEFKGTMSDVEALCRMGNEDIAYDIFDDSNIREVIRKRKEKQTSVNESRKKARVESKQNA